MPFILEEEQVFVDEKSDILFYGQPVGIILADSFELANLAVTKVKIMYIEEDGNL